MHMSLVRDQLFCDAESVSMKNVYHKMISLESRGNEKGIG